MTEKLIGALLLFLGGTLAGKAAADGVRRREALTEDMIFSLGVMQSEMELLQTPTPALLKRLSGLGGTECRAFFAEVLREMEKKPLMIAWQEASDRLCMPGNAAETVARLGAVLGRFDSVSQSREIEHCRRTLGEIIQIERRGSGERRRAYIGAGACLGLTAAVILI